MVAPDPPEPAGPERGAHDARKGWLFALLALALGCFAYRPLWSWEPTTHELPPLEGWIFLASDRPPQAIFAVAGALAALRWRSIVAALSGPKSTATGVPLVALALALLACGRWHSSPELSLLSAVTFGLGAGSLLGGRPLMRRLAMPLVLLLFALPLPRSLYLPWVYELERATVGFAAWAIQWLQIPAMRVGEILTLPTARFMVIETCSGAGSIAILTLLAVFWVGLTQAPLVRAIALIAVAPPLALLLNGVRVVTLILTPGSEGARLHALQGVLLFQGGILGLWLIDRALIRLLPTQPQAPGATVAEGQRPAWARLTACCGLAALVSVAAPAAPPRPAVPPWSMALPAELLGAPSEPRPVDHRFLGSLRFAWSQHAAYGTDGTAVDVFVASGDPEDPRTALNSPKNRVSGRGHEILSVESQPLGEIGLFGEEVIALRKSRRVLSWVLYEGQAGPWAEAVTGALGLRPPALGTTTRQRLLRLSTMAGNSLGDLNTARARLDASLTLFGPIFAAP